MQQQFLHAADTFTACAQAIENGTVGDPLFALNVYFALAEHHRRLGQHDAAAPYYQQAMKQLDFILKPEALAETSARLSQEHLRIAHAALGDWYAARSRILFQFAQARHRIAQAASNLGLTLQTLGDLQAAEQQLRQTIDLCSRLGARRQAILARIALADLLPKRQQLPEAKRLALEAEALSRPAGQDQIGDEMLFGRVLVTLGNVYKALNRLDEADGYFQQAISLLKRLNAREPLSQAYYSYSELLHLKKLDAESYEMVNLAYLLSQPRHDEPPTDIC
jgi:tetratricopeptide (TPR) repeat protein